jgi:hypothetical protein
MRTQLPHDAQRTTIEYAGDNHIFTQGSSSQVPKHIENTLNPPQIWDKAPTWIKTSLMKYCDTPSNWESIKNSISNGTCVALTDGSFDPFSYYATACWIIEGNDRNNRCKGVSHTPGNDDDTDEYRDEIFGIYCIMVCLKYICEHFEIKKGSVKIVCDCLGALTCAVMYNNRPTT